jgi:xanthine dehydrogenase FAD-binding subunit
MSMEYKVAASVEEALELLAGPGHRRAVGGGTDLAVVIADGVIAPDVLVDVAALPGLRDVRKTAEGISIGAAVRISEVAGSADLPACLRQGASAIGSPQIRNLATIGGNVCNASPAGDLLTPLLALDAEAELARLSDHGKVLTRRVPLAGFFTGPGRTVREPHELLTALHLPLAPPNQVVRFYKGGTRQGLDISSISIALAARRGHHGSLRDVRLALGAVAPTPTRARGAEAALEGRGLDAATIRAAAEAAAADAKPIDDVRASAWYRRELLRNMTERMLTDVAQS